MNRMGERVRFNKGLYAWMGFRSIGDIAASLAQAL